MCVCVCVDRDYLTYYQLHIQTPCACTVHALCMYMHQQCIKCSATHVLNIILRTAFPDILRGPIKCLHTLKTQPWQDQATVYIQYVSIEILGSDSIGLH